tara:strand:+ start:398 stop:1432 length:1035 start_codon:yes stop_codon:yes gene_type:complete
MKMKKILTEWRKFVITEAIEKTNLEKKIEASWPGKYNEVLADAKAAIHAARFLNGGSVNNLEDYLNRVEFGKTGKERIQSINRKAEQFAEMFTAVEVYSPVYDKRFVGPDGSAPEKKLKGIGIVPTFANYNFKGSDKEGVYTSGKTEEEAYSEFFAKFEQLDSMLEQGDYNFLSTFGRVDGKTDPNARHSGGAFSTGLIILPEEATEEEVERVMESYKFYLNHQADPAYIMAIKAEEELQKALSSSLGIWRKYGGFKDGADEQANKGPWLRMQKALSASEEVVKRIKQDPTAYKSGASIKPKEDDVEAMIIAARGGDKEAAGKAFAILRKSKDKRSREMRSLMR